MTETPKEPLSLVDEDPRVVATPKAEKPTKEAWEAYREKIRGLYDEVSKKAESLYGANGERLVRNRVCGLRDRIPRKEFNPHDYIAYHKIIGSGTGYEITPLLDMPKPYSVEDFLLKLKDDLDDTEKCQTYINRGFRE